MGNMKQWAMPLIIFVVGEILFLIFILFFPTVDETMNQTAAETENVSDIFWGWDWVTSPGVGRSAIIAGYQIGLMFSVGAAFLHESKKNQS